MPDPRKLTPRNTARAVTAGVRDQTFRSAWRRLVRLWRPMAAWTVLVWLGLAAILAPLSSALLGWGALRGDRAVIGNEEMMGWLATVPGLAWMLLAGALILMGWLIRYAGLFYIITDDLEGLRPGIGQTAADLAPRLPALGRLCLLAAGAGVALTTPLVAGLAAIRWLFLRGHDINYYLADSPAEWRWALAAGVAWSALWLVPAVYLALRVVFVVPAYLDGHRPLRTALRRSWNRTRGSGGRLVRLLASTVVVWLVARAALQATYSAAGGAVLGWGGGGFESLRAIVLLTAVVLGGAVALDAVIAFLGFSFTATLATKFYYEDTDLHEIAPSVARLRDMPGKAVQTVRAVPSRIGRAPAVAAVIVLLGGSIVLSGILLEGVAEVRPARVIAHRAGPPPSPENTLAALERAIAHGADAAEIDVQRTRDGVVVVTHDADLMRVAGDPRRVRDVTHADIAGLVQRPDDGSPAEERRVATLAEFIERARGRIGLAIELKYYGPEPGLAPAVVREVRRLDAAEEVVLMSLDRSAVEQVRALDPGLRVGYVVAAAVGDPTRLDVDFLALSRTRVSPRFLRLARDRRLEVHAWTVNRAADMAELVERGVDAVITDDPALATRVNAELVALPTPARLLLRFRGLGLGEEAPAADEAWPGAAGRSDSAGSNAVSAGSSPDRGDGARVAAPFRSSIPPDQEAP